MALMEIRLCTLTDELPFSNVKAPTTKVFMKKNKKNYPLTIRRYVYPTRSGECTKQHRMVQCVNYPILTCQMLISDNPDVLLSVSGAGANQPTCVLPKLLHLLRDCMLSRQWHRALEVLTSVGKSPLGSTYPVWKVILAMNLFSEAACCRINDTWLLKY